MGPLTASIIAAPISLPSHKILKKKDSVRDGAEQAKSALTHGLPADPELRGPAS